MKHPAPEVVAAMAGLNRQSPVVLTFLDEWLAAELKALPLVTQNTAIAQGRCQVLLELTKLLKDAPELADTRRDSPKTHTDRSV